MSSDSADNQSLHQLRSQFPLQQDELKALLEQPTPGLDASLADDARSLLFTLKFSLFVQLLLVELAAQPEAFPHLSQLSADLSLWLLPSLPLPLRLRRLPHRNAADLTQVQMQLGAWHQAFGLPVAGTDDETATRAWDTIAVQLHTTRVRLPIASNLQVFLSRELMSILTYLSEFEVEFLTASQEQAL